MNPKCFIALARVSSREQEREGFSLDVQEDALQHYAKRQGGTIVQMYKIAETASKRDERQTFKAVLEYAKQHAKEVDGLLFYKVDRAARNIFDYVELERLELDFGVPVIYISQPTENSPAGRMQRRILSNMASFYTEQQSLDVREGQSRRVQQGLFVGVAPFGYRNVRIDGRGLIEVDPVKGPKVKRIFELYAYHGHTLDSLMKQLEAEGIEYASSQPNFTRSKVHSILKDRAYIGDVFFRGQWHSGKQEPLIDRITWDRVQVLLGDKVYRSHEMMYAGELIRCAHCGRPITGEAKTKNTKEGSKEYVYYRCARYNTEGHPRVRVTESDMDQQILGLFEKLKVKDENVSRWFVKVLRARTQETQQADRKRRDDLQRQMSTLVGQQDRLLNLRLSNEIESGTFSTKHTELRDRIAQLTLSLEACDRGRHENADLAVKAFELSQCLEKKWLNADYTAKRQILEIVCLNFTLDNATLVPVIRKPFDILAEGLILKDDRGDRI